LTTGEYVLNVVLDSGLTREFTLTFPDPLRLRVWKASLEGDSAQSFAPEDDTDSILRQYEDERSQTQGTPRGRMSDSASNSSQDLRSSSNYTSNFTTPTTQFTSEFGSVSPRDGNGKPITSRAAVDAVVVVSVASSMHGLKLQILKDALKFIAKNLGDYDRMALIVFGGSSGPEVIAGMTRKSIPVWERAIDALESGPRGVKSEVIEGVNLGMFVRPRTELMVALEMLSKRRASNPVTSILVISDSPSGGTDPVEQAISQANSME
jgi:Mg-chelatase subunit ChlD